MKVMELLLGKNNLSPIAGRMSKLMIILLWHNSRDTWLFNPEKKASKENPLLRVALKTKNEKFPVVPPPNLDLVQETRSQREKFHLK